MAAERAAERAASETPAEALCRLRGVTLTPLRRQVLDLVIAAEKPVGAYALLDRLKAERPGAAPPTVYRALEFLLENGLIHRIEKLNAFIGCAEAQAGHDHHHPHQFLICRRCGETAEIADQAAAEALEAAASAQGFRPERMVVEIEGLCAACAAAG
jgi:Fur family zinc uptake transcriptional regulator